MIHEPVTFLSDDADQDPHYALTIYQAENGDWYIAVMPDGHKIGPNVRVCTSGGASHSHPGMTTAVHRLYDAIKAGRQQRSMCEPCLVHKHLQCTAAPEGDCGCPECYVAANRTIGLEGTE